MARAVPVNKPKEEPKEEAVKADPRRPASEPEYTPNKPKNTYTMPNGTIVEDY